MDVILTSTALGGELMGRPNEIGKVQPGYFADVILVNGNPLDDISVLSKHQNIEVVIIVRSISLYLIYPEYRFAAFRTVVSINSRQKMVKYGTNLLVISSTRPSGLHKFSSRVQVEILTLSSKISMFLAKIRLCVALMRSDILF